jgi:hypothetical protein
MLTNAGTYQGDNLTSPRSARSFILQRNMLRIWLSLTDSFAPDAHRTERYQRNKKAARARARAAF